MGTRAPCGWVAPGREEGKGWRVGGERWGEQGRAAREVHGMRCAGWASRERGETRIKPNGSTEMSKPLLLQAEHSLRGSVGKQVEKKSRSNTRRGLRL